MLKSTCFISSSDNITTAHTYMIISRGDCCVKLGFTLVTVVAAYQKALKESRFLGV